MTIYISRRAAEALNTVGIGKFGLTNPPEQMAWAVLIMKELSDRPEWFPGGKWATIQYIEGQLQAAAYIAARNVP